MRSAGLTHVVSLGRLERRSKKKGGEIPPDFWEKSPSD